MIQDSGTRREFETGAVRDIAEGKGRCDLLPLEFVAQLVDFCGNLDARLILEDIDSYVTDGEAVHLLEAMKRFIAHNFDGSVSTAILEVSKHFEEGCNKYGPNNWRKGIPLHCYIDSAVRHYLKFLRGDDDERHDRAFLWNLLCCLWTQRNKPELNDLPFAEKKKEELIETDPEISSYKIITKGPFSN